MESSEVPSASGKHDPTMVDTSHRSDGNQMEAGRYVRCTRVFSNTRLLVIRDTLGLVPCTGYDNIFVYQNSKAL